MKVKSGKGGEWFWIAIWGLVLIVGSSGCSRKSPDRGEVVRPIKSFVVVSGGETQVRSFPGKVEASKKVEMAFQVSGLLVKLPVKEGQKVAKGELIAQLRQDEFQARLKTLQGQLDQSRAALRALQAGDRPEQRLRLEAQLRAALAQLSNAKTEFDRAARLLQQRAMSRADHDRYQTAYRVALEEHQAARQMLEKGTMAREEDIEAQEAEVRGLEGRVVEAQIQLADSTLVAPYDGVIGKRFVEPNQTIKGREPVVKFQDVDELEVAVDVPETFMAASLRLADIVQMVAEFSGAPGLQFPVQLREIAQRADPATQTFRIRVALKALPDQNILPGMTARVTITYRRAGILGQQIMVPITAVSNDGGGKQSAWVIGADQQVTRRPVKMGEATGSQIQILEGLEPGERIAVAGLTFLREGMKVRDLGDALGGSQP